MANGLPPRKIERSPGHASVTSGDAKKGPAVLPALFLAPSLSR